MCFKWTFINFQKIKFKFFVFEFMYNFNFIIGFLNLNLFICKFVITKLLVLFLFKQLLYILLIT